VLDGDIVSLDADGRSNFHKLLFCSSQMADRRAPCARRGRARQGDCRPSGQVATLVRNHGRYERLLRGRSLDSCQAGSDPVTLPDVTVTFIDAHDPMTLRARSQLARMWSHREQRSGFIEAANCIHPAKKIRKHDDDALCGRRGLHVILDGDSGERNEIRSRIEL
jgi:hypothetical protein